MLGLGAAVVASWATGAGAQSALSETWAKRESLLLTASATDEAAEVAAYFDGNGAARVFVVGTMTNAFGGTCIGLVSYDPYNPGDARWAYFPLDYDTTTAQHRAVAIAVQPGGGLSDTKVYITGTIPQVTGSATDVVTMKFALNQLGDLQLDSSWSAQSPDPDGVRRFAGTAGGNDAAADIAYLFATQSTVQTPRVFVTTRSYGGSTTGDNIVTLCYDTFFGTLVATDTYNGPADGADYPAELAVPSIIDVPTAGNDTYVAIGGTSFGGSDAGNDVVARVLDINGAHLWTTRYDSGGEDRCTSIATARTTSGSTAYPVLVGGSSVADPTVPDDSHYLAVALNDLTGAAWWSGSGARTWSPSTLDDIALDCGFATSETTTFAVLTGQARSGEAYDAGTAVFSLESAGTLLDTDLFGSAGVPDERAVSYAGGPNGSLFVAGWRYEPNNDPAYLTQTLRYSISIGGVLTLSAVGASAGDGGENKLFHAAYVPDALLVTGRSAADLTGLDFFTIRYAP